MEGDRDVTRPFIREGDRGVTRPFISEGERVQSLHFGREPGVKRS